MMHIKIGDIMKARRESPCHGSVETSLRTCKKYITVNLYRKQIIKENCYVQHTWSSGLQSLGEADSSNILER